LTCSERRHKLETTYDNFARDFGERLVPGYNSPSVVDSHYVQGMPLGRICARWQLNYGSVIASLHHIADIFAPVMKQLQAGYRQSLVRHADETGWRTDGQSGYCWLFARSSVSQGRRPHSSV
jgi:hypothetical protein